MPVKLKERNISYEHNRNKNPNWQEAHQSAIYRCDQGLELGSTKKQLQLKGQSGTNKPVTFRVQHPDHLATLP